MYQEKQMDDFIRPLSQTTADDISLVGGKNASLGEMIRELAPHGIRVPGGFAVTVAGYHYFLESGGLHCTLHEQLDGLRPADVDDLQRRGSAIRHAILATELPAALSAAIRRAYADLSSEAGRPVDVAVRSSATAEDLPEASFAGQQETYLNVQGESMLLECCRRCYASLFTDRAISYRVDQQFDHFKVALSIGVQPMVRADLGAAGVMFSIDTETGFSNAVLINAAYGLGENVVQGSVNPDEYYVFKPTLRDGFRPILKKKLGSKEFKLVYDVGGSKMVRNVPVSAADRCRFALADDEILLLARWACQIEDHYSQKRGQPCPMDMEWAKDGRTGELFILQARPETVQSRREVEALESYRLVDRGPVLASGRSVGEKIAAGPARIIPAAKDLAAFQPGEVLVTDKTDPDWEPIMKSAAAIVTNRGGRTCHAAIVSRELGLPAIVGTENATNVVRNGQVVTVSCAEGETGFLYDGRLEFAIERVPLAGLTRPRTKVMMNVGNPDEAFRLSKIPNDGVGLARMEFIISNSIKIHPMALIEYDQIEEPSTKAEIDRLTVGWQDKPRFFVDMLAEGVAMIAAAFYPRDVIVRMSDFKTNEYANLLGGRKYEPVEENPMIGFRGASRYYHPRYREAFGLECQAMKRVRDEMGLTNVKLMIPFCRTVQEARLVRQEMLKHGLERGVGGLELYVMCEIPSNVLSAPAFAEEFDGFSIGSNDLTQLVLGVDRDSTIVAPVFDERDPAVLGAITEAIRAAHAAGRKIGICGQAPSDYPGYAAFLVRQRIDSISLNPDAVLKTTLEILRAEQELEQPTSTTTSLASVRASALAPVMA
jgi:pyruvate,water dikinase